MSESRESTLRMEDKGWGELGWIGWMVGWAAVVGTTVWIIGGKIVRESGAPVPRAQQDKGVGREGGGSPSAIEGKCGSTGLITLRSLVYFPLLFSLLLSSAMRAGLVGISDVAI
jgi:hypothetical protein